MDYSSQARCRLIGPMTLKRLLGSRAESLLSCKNQEEFEGRLSPPKKRSPTRQGHLAPTAAAASDASVSTLGASGLQS